VAENTARNLKWHASELKPPPLLPLEEGDLNEDEVGDSRSKKKKKGKADPRNPSSVRAGEGVSGQAAVQAFYVKQRNDKEDADLIGISCIKMGALAKSVQSSSRTGRLDEKILSSVIETGTYLAADIGFMMLMLNTHSVSLCSRFF